MNPSLCTIFIFAAVISLGFLSSTGTATCHPDDEAGLLAFKAGITQDSEGVLSAWKKGGDCCSWNGVTCMTGDRVTHLSLSGSDTEVGRGFISGTISPSLAKLQHLEGVYFNNLIITGSFPHFFFRLPKLDTIRITGTHLSGPLSTNIDVLSKITDLYLKNNRFTGPIPGSMSNLTRLINLNLDGNSLSGTIPDIFKSMAELQGLQLSHNRLSGKLPPSIASLAQTLTYLDLSKNNLSGMIPNCFSRFKSLSTLDLSSNQFSGVLPTSFANLTSLSRLSLSHNLLTGPLPALKFHLDIGTLDLSYNQFHLKKIPNWVTSSLTNLKLARCGITMRIEDWKPMKIESCQIIDLSENEFSGNPARFLNQAEQLLEFYASGNKLRFDLGKLSFTKLLRVLDLSRNLVFGKVPAWVAELETLYLSQNHLCGKLPVTRFPASVFASNDCLCGYPLSPCKP